MKKKIILPILLFSMLLTGCSFLEESTLAHEGKVALEKHEYKDAMTKLSSALEEDSSDEGARAMYMQAMRMSSVDYYEQKGDLKKAIEDLKAIEEIKGGSSQIKSEASDKKKEFTKLQENLEKDQITRKEKAKESASGYKYKEQQVINSHKPKVEKEEKEEVIEEKKEESTTPSDGNTSTVPPTTSPSQNNPIIQTPTQTPTNTITNQ